MPDSCVEEFSVERLQKQSNRLQQDVYLGDLFLAETNDSACKLAYNAFWVLMVPDFIQRHECCKTFQHNDRQSI